MILVGADEHAGGRVAEQIRAALDGKRLINRGSGQHLTGVTISIGVAELRASERPASWLERADAALYQAKNTGRNKVCISASLSTALLGWRSASSRLARRRYTNIERGGGRQGYRTWC